MLQVLLSKVLRRQNLPSEMWNKRLLRTIPPSSEEPGGGRVGRCSALCLILVSVLVIVSGSVAEARYYPMENNNLRDSATAMIEFRGALKRIIIGSRDSSLTFVVLGEKEKVASHVQGLRFHVVENPLLCDENLSQDEVVTARFVSESEDVLVAEERDDEVAIPPLVNYVCAVWPVQEEVLSGNNINQRLEWLSANGIEQRSTEGEQHIMVMHLEKPLVHLKR